MKRSEVNAILASAEAFFNANGFHLPPFADWTVDDYRREGEATSAIRRAGLGWDVTDFGSDDFATTGLTLFTLRNGTGEFGSVPYAEKLMLVEPGQRTPLHFHWRKTEDIIVRAGGRLALRLYGSRSDEEPDIESPISVWTDGCRRTLAAGECLEIGPGESVTLIPGTYHEFWGVSRRVLVGEVSSVNDDATDNRFWPEAGRFPDIEEDAEPWRLLVTDVARL